jgi:hypothetical protein
MPIGMAILQWERSRINVEYVPLFNHVLAHSLYISLCNLGSVWNMPECSFA